MTRDSRRGVATWVEQDRGEKLDTKEQHKEELEEVAHVVVQAQTVQVELAAGQLLQLVDVLLHCVESALDGEGYGLLNVARERTRMCCTQNILITLMSLRLQIYFHLQV